MNKIRSFVARFRLLCAVVAATIAGIAFVGAPASAGGPTLPPMPADPTGGAMSDTVDNTMTWVTTYGIPALALAIGFGILVRLGFKWLRRAGRAIG